MPRGKKKTDVSNNNLNNEKNDVQTAAEIAVPVDVKAEQPKKAAETTTKKAKSKAGRKPKANKTAAAPKAPKSDKSAKTKAVAADNLKTTKKSASSEKKTPAKTGKNAKNAKKSAAPAPVTAAVTTEKKKRTYNKKANTVKSDDVIIQSSGSEYTMADITEKCRSDYRNGSRKQIKSIKVYIKAENNGIRAYYVVNDSANGHIDL